MRVVFEADNPIQAHLVRHALEDAGLLVFVLGEQLIGGVGELPAGSLIRLAVPDPHVAAAEALLRELPLATGEAEGATRAADDGETDGMVGLPA